MTLYENWISSAYDQNGNAVKDFWDTYMPIEQKIYEKLIGEKTSTLSGTIKELGGRFHISAEYTCGLLDGLNEALTNEIDMKSLDSDTFIDIEIDFERLYRKMIDYKAEHLYTLPEWKNIFSDEELNKIYLNQKKSRTIVKEKKIGRNELCPCNSGKKYKKCCGLSDN